MSDILNSSKNHLQSVL